MKKKDSIITVTDKNDVALIDDADIKKWISLHQRALKDETMKEHWDAIKVDLIVLKAEWKLRNPLISVTNEILVSLNKINTNLESLADSLSKISNKEKKHGTSKN